MVIILLASYNKNMKNKNITRAELEKNLSTKDWGEKGSDEREVALILLCSVIVGANRKSIEKVLGNPSGVLNKVEVNARENGIWTKNGKVNCEWLDKKTGSVALACDVAVCLGWIKRVEDIARKGGKARAKKLSSKRRKEIASKAGKAKKSPKNETSQ